MRIFEVIYTDGAKHIICAESKADAQRRHPLAWLVYEVWIKMKLPYNHDYVEDYFTKQKDYIIWVKGEGEPIMAGLFEPYMDAGFYVWMEKNTCREIHDKITHYMCIPE